MHPLFIRCQLANSNWCVSDITSRTFARHEDVDDVTYSAKAMLLMHAAPGGLSLQRELFLCKFQANRSSN